MIIAKSRFTSREGNPVQGEEWDRLVDCFWYSNEYTREYKEDDGSSFYKRSTVNQMYKKKKKVLFQIT